MPNGRQCCSSVIALSLSLTFSNSIAQSSTNGSTDSTQNAPEAPAPKKGFMATFADAYQKAKEDRAAKKAAGEQASGATSITGSQSPDTSQWTVRGLKLGQSQNAATSMMEEIFHSKPKVSEGRYKVSSGAFTSANVVLSHHFSANSSNSPAAIDESGTVPSRALLDIAYTWPSPGTIFAVQYASRYDGPNYTPQNLETLPKLQKLKQVFFGQLGNPVFAQEAGISGLIAPTDDTLGGWSETLGAGNVTWLWTAGSDYKTSADYRACAEIKVTGGAFAWLRGDRANNDPRAPKCGQFLRVDIKRVDMEHVYSLSITMIDQKSYADMSTRFDAYLEHGDSSAQAATADLPQINSTALAKLFTTYPYDGTPKSYFPRVAITVTDWNRPTCWYARATLWSSASKSELVGPFSTCWGSANFNWKLQSPGLVRLFEAQKPSESTGNIRSIGPKAPLRAGVDAMPVDASGAYNDFVHAILNVTGWQEGAPTNIWIVGFQSDAK